MLTLLPLLAFAFGTLVITAGAWVLLAPKTASIDQRLREVVGGAAAPPEASTDRQQIAAFLKRIGERVPKSASELTTIQLRLVQAGYRRPDALMVFLGIRFALAIALFALFAFPILFRPSVGLGLLAAAIGYVLPAMVLARIGKKRQRTIQLSLPDALDLLVVSVEAGLGLDQAMARVAQELAFAHKELSGELRLVNLELLAGTARADALRNLADRTGVEDLKSLVAMLVQTDKFGTSVAHSLRVFSETMRTKRRQRAEEAAAKTGVKMVFPLVVCIFPAIWFVTIGPAAIKFIRVMGTMETGK
jgi:tight adherence protein C